jgi:hypothetical protein
MPLTYDDIPGSWGVYSRGWPEIKGDVAFDMYVFANCYISIPYGSYVLMSQRGKYGDKETCLRVEYEHLAQLKADFERAGKPTSDESVAYREKHGKKDEWGRRTRAPIGLDAK